MIFIGILALASAVILSVASALFSINGIQTIFSGAIVWSTVMSASMEFAKVSSTIWLYQFWGSTKKALKIYLMFAIVILILISSIGIYGFLSKAYVGQSEGTAKLTNNIRGLELSIDKEQRNIDRANTNIEMLDSAIQGYLDSGWISRSLEKRDEQETERTELWNKIMVSEDLIMKYQNEIIDIQNQAETLSINVGPIKYIAILLYGEDNAESNYDNAARIFIVLLVIVFDPLAVLLMVAGNIAVNEWQKQRKKKIKNRNKDVPITIKDLPETTQQRPEQVIEPVESDIVKETVAPVRQKETVVAPESERKHVVREIPDTKQVKEIVRKGLPMYDPLDTGNPLNHGL